MISRNRKWLAPIPWAQIVEQNRRICEAGKVPSEPVAEQSELVRKFWETVAAQELDLHRALDALRECIQKGPFRYNSLTTFSTVSLKLIEPATRQLGAVEAKILGSTVKKYVEGRIAKAELREVLDHFSRQLESAAWDAEATSATPPVRPQPQPT